MQRGSFDIGINARAHVRFYIVCEERASFGDLTRIARHKNADARYGADFGNRWFARKLAYKAAGLEQRLLDQQNWYLPFK